MSHPNPPRQSVGDLSAGVGRGGDQPLRPWPFQPARRSGMWLVAVAAVVLGAAAGAGVTGVVLAGGDGGDGQGPVTAISAPVGTRLQATKAACTTLGDNVRLDDQGHSLSFSAAGPGGMSLAGYECIMRKLDAPDSLLAEVENTRALDGTLEATWDVFSASWTYHPAEGLRMVIIEE